MELITVPKVENVRMLDKYNSSHTIGTLYPTATHLLFVDAESKKEIWILNTHIAVMEKLPLSTTGSPLHIKCKNFHTVTFVIPKERDCHEIYLTLLRLSTPAKLEDLYCFNYQPNKDELPRDFGWDSFSIQREFERQGVPNKDWILTNLNFYYNLCETYPKYLYVPATCTNDVLLGSSLFRSKRRLPVLTYLHPNNASISRCSQPLSGFNGRCPKDEQMLHNILRTNSNSQYMFVVDTRPRINAMANRATGKGYENENFYDNIKFQFFGIENIHVMRTSLNKVLELQKCTSMNGFINGLKGSGWLQHIRAILETSWFIARAISNGVNVVVHCSDGWDRTSQVCSLAALLLDPFYRTIKGYQALIEKDWLSFGHKFSDRSGHINIDSNEIAPVFTQFVDATYQVLQQYPYMFEFNEYFLMTLHDHVHSCQYGTFVGNCEKERQMLRLSERTHSLWAYITKHIHEYINPAYTSSKHKAEHKKVLQPQLFAQSIVFWKEFYFRFENGIHSRESSKELLQSINNHTNSLEDHMKLLVKVKTPEAISSSSTFVQSMKDNLSKNFQRVKSLGELLTNNQDKPEGSEDNKKEPVILEESATDEHVDAQNEKTIGEEIPDVSQIKEEMQSVALDWQLSRNANQCPCSVIFDAFNRKYHCYSCGNVFCVRCMGEESVLPGHSSQEPVPTCKTCTRKNSTSSP